MGRPHSIHEMMLYIPKKLKHFEGTIRNIDEASARIIERLIEREYLDDLKFIEWWVDNRTYFRPRGVRGLMSELMQKGVDKNLLEEFFANNPVEEVELATRILIKKAKVLAELDIPTRKKKATDLLLRKGFPYSVIQVALEHLENLLYNTTN